MALREINLIPVDTLSFRYLQRHLFFWAGCLALSISLVGSYFLYQTRFVLDKKSHMTNLKNIHTQLGTKINEINTIQIELERLDQQQSMLKTIKRNQSYSAVLFKLSDIMNEDTWITNLVINSNINKENEDVENLELTGFSYSNEKLGNFINRLSGDDKFKDVLLKYSKEAKMSQFDPNKDANVSLIAFQIECKMYK